MQITEKRNLIQRKKIPLENMLMCDMVKFTTRDKKEIYYTQEHGRYRVEVGNTIFFFDGFLAVFNFLKKYRIKTGVQLTNAVQTA